VFTIPVMDKKFTTALEGNDSAPSLKNSTIESYPEPAETKPHRQIRDMLLLILSSRSDLGLSRAVFV
jgi:hypothetical protein